MEEPELFDEAGRTPAEDELPLLLAGDHAQADRWLRAVLMPRVDEEPDRVPWLAEGALLRLRAAARCDRRDRSDPGLTDGSSPTD